MGHHGVGMFARLLTFGLLLLCGGCTFIPASGPNRWEVEAGHTANGPQYGLVRLRPESINTLLEYSPKGLSGVFPDKRPPQTIKFGIGDVVSVTIFESSAGGLFIPAEAGVRPGNFVQIPNQNVDSAGNITVPYAGAVRAAGRTVAEIQQDIVSAIKNRAIDPQVIVALADQRTSLITVLGEVNLPSRLIANAAGERILDVISRAGGIKGQGYETWVTLERNGKRSTVPFGALVYEPNNNIWAHPGDSFYIYREPQVFLAFGAAGQQGQFTFDMWKITLSQAMAKAGGLLDGQAEPASVYVYRREPRELAERLGVDCSKFEGPTVPIIYNVNFRDPGGFFLATKFQMRDKDVLFAANADAVESSKLLSYINQVIATANNTTVAGQNSIALRNLTRQ